MQADLSRDQQKLKTISQNVTDPILQISENGYTPLGNLKTYGVQGLYDRPEPTNLRDLKELYTLPYSTTPFLGNVTTSRKDVDIDSDVLRYPVYNNKKSGVGTSQVVLYPEELKINTNMSFELNTFLNQNDTINSNTYENNIELNENEIGLGVSEFSPFIRNINRWDYIDPKITQNVDNIIMNITTLDNTQVSLPQCGLSSRNELRNYVEKNSC